MQIYTYARRIFELVVISAIAKGIIIFLNSVCGIYPDQWVFSFLMIAKSPPVWVAWVISGLLGLLGVFAIERWGWPWVNRGAHGKLKQHTAAVPARIPLLELREQARRQGWDIESEVSLEVMDLMDGLRQLGLDGVLFWGRQVRIDDVRFAHSEPLSPIPAEHWRDFQIDVQFIALPRDNLQVHTYSMQNHLARQGVIGGYADIHVEKERALAWLVSEEARTLRGRRDRHNAGGRFQV